MFENLDEVNQTFENKDQDKVQEVTNNNQEGYGTKKFETVGSFIVSN